jgi:hypothetical protein
MEGDWEKNHSPNFSSLIVGLKKEESDVLLNFLNLHVTLGVDFQARLARWESGTVVIFDNCLSCNTSHSFGVVVKVSGKSRAETPQPPDRMTECEL